MRTKVLQILAISFLTLFSASAVSAQSALEINQSCTAGKVGYIFSFSPTHRQMVDCTIIQRLGNPFNLIPIPTSEYVIDPEQQKLTSVMDGSGMDDDTLFALTVDNSDQFLLVAAVSTLTSVKDGKWQTFFLYTPMSNLPREEGGNS